MNCKETTTPGGTMTSEGFIKHKLHPAGFEMPVMLDIALSRVRIVALISEPQPPMRDRAGRLVYARPGGGMES